MQQHVNAISNVVFFIGFVAFWLYMSWVLAMGGWIRLAERFLNQKGNGRRQVGISLAVHSMTFATAHALSWAQTKRGCIFRSSSYFDL